MKVVQFSNEHKTEWDDFVSLSKNGTFLFYRDYMIYHADRFDDHSLLFYDDKDTLVALLPANATNTRLDSHGGLTYGGFVSDSNMKIPMMLNCFIALNHYAKQFGFEDIRYRTIPHIYHQIPSQEDLYALHLCGANCISRSVLTTIDTKEIVAFQNRRQRQIKKANKKGIIVQQSNDLDGYWGILTELLQAVHNTDPVHSLNEISYLQQQFPDNIKLFTARHDGKIVAGILVYETTRTVRTQYIAANYEGRKLGALDKVFDYLIHEVYHDKPYIEFGTSEKANAKVNYLNSGLIDQKEGFGGRTVIQDQYLINLNLNSVTQLEEAYS